jgi:hypothetical protein
MNTLVIGGHTRNIGKTALVVDIIRAFPEIAWTALKITQHGHGVCSINGKECDCAPEEHGFALDEEQDRANRTDTSRFLVAGAARSVWVRTRQGCLGEFLPRVLREIPAESNLIIESNSIMEFVRPALYLVVLDPGKEDFKESARRYLHLADAFILRGPLDCAPWLKAAEGSPLVVKREVESKPCYRQDLGVVLPPALREYIWHRSLSHWHHTGGHSADICC